MPVIQWAQTTRRKLQRDAPVTKTEEIQPPCCAHSGLAEGLSVWARSDDCPERWKEIEPMATQMKTTALLKAKPGKTAELETLLRNLASRSRSEPGNLRWDLWQDLDDATTFVVDELYRDIASVQAHRATPHFQDYASKINDLAARTAVTSRPIDTV